MPKPVTTSTPPDRVTRLPGLGKVTNVQFAGYASIHPGGIVPLKAEDERLFYWFAGADNYAKKPTVLWSNGGPGSSSFWGFFLENGPYEIAPDGAKLKPSPTSWTQHFNYMIFEHPLSVTLSAAKNKGSIPRTVEEGIEQLYQALLNFLDLHPEIAKNPIILAGESYAGTYLPLLAQAILKGNKKAKRKLDLQMVVLCDAWVDPYTQMATDTAYAHSHGLISAEQKKALDKEYAKKKLPQINAAIQKICGCYMTNIAQSADPSFDPIITYLNRADVRKALHIPADYPPLKDNWSKQIAKNYAPQVNDSYVPTVQALLNAGMKLRIVSGLNDAKDCNFLGTEAWLQKLKGKAATEFKTAAAVQWKDEKKNVLGFSQGKGQLGWLKVLNAGHMAARDQPKLIEYLVQSL
jgi:vitellogenic carboxypeptidase-like protein